MLQAIVVAAATLLPRAQEARPEFAPIRVGDPAATELAPFFPSAEYDASVPRPEQVLGQEVGTRAASHAEVLAYFDALDAASERVAVTRTGRSFEGRELLFAVITSPANHARLDAIRGGLAALKDPRNADSATLEAALGGPAVAWLGYSIHGDEMSGVDASLVVAHHLAADRTPQTARLLDELVVVIDPIMNPDGRERILSMVRQHAGYQSALNNDGMQRGTWPWGRGNHYLFDMNRDWLPGTCPETRARWAAVQSFQPQLFIDAHEMGGLDTFLFSPPREPIQLHQWTKDTDWQQVFAREQADAFDARGWSYYTREWFEGWGPFYSDSWASLGGAVGILYEQARYMSSPLRRASGEIVNYRDAVSHQAVSSLANLRTLRTNRAAILADFARIGRESLEPDTLGNDRLFAFVPGRHPSREARFVQTLSDQGIECYRLEQALQVRNARSTLTAPIEDSLPELELPAGTIVISPRQPQSSRLKAYLEFDPRFSDEVLQKEREDLEQRAESGVYDVTSWSLATAFDLDAWWADHDGYAPGSGTLVARLEGPAAGAATHPLARDAQGAVAAELARAPYGWVVDGRDDRAPAFAVRALEAGLAVHLSDKAFTTGAVASEDASAGEPAPVEFARGSLLIRRIEHPERSADGSLRTIVDDCARASDVRAFGVYTARSRDESPDLGGGHFTLLERPRIGLFGNSPFAPDTYGHVWRELDVELGLPVTLLDAQGFAPDLRQFNVLIVPSAWGELGGWLEGRAEDLRSWMQSGGTLIVIAGSAAALCDPELELTSVRRRRDVLDELERYQYAAWRERQALAVELDSERIWGDPRPPQEQREESEDPEDQAGQTEEHDSEQQVKADSDAGSGPNGTSFLERAVHPDAATHDAWQRRFAPQGALVRGLVDQHSWLTVGCGRELPVFVRGDHVLLTDTGVDAPIRLATPERLRLSGLIWPEAAQRLAESAYVTVERRGRGQVILFAATPGFRGLFRSSARLLANAVVYGPGAGADPVREW